MNTAASPIDRQRSCDVFKNMENIRWVALVILILFSSYTIYAGWRESFWKTLKGILQKKWGLQIFTDLFLGLLLFNFIIYLNEGSAWIAIGWFTASLILGNITTLFYFVLYFEAIVSHFRAFQ
jgi:hypothetical protein